MDMIKRQLPHKTDNVFLAYVGMETDIIFNKGIDLPGFAAYPLLENQEGREIIKNYHRDFIKLAQSKNLGAILETPTWVANRSRAESLGYTPDQLRLINADAVQVLSEVRAEFESSTIILSTNLGPRDDAYAPSEQMSADEAKTYHMEQLAIFVDGEVDLVSGYTIAYTAEATGMVLAAKALDLPIIISFTVETDGRLPTGAALEEAISEVDEAKDGYADYFMINCAHPDHFTSILKSAPWMSRIKGVVANASRCSHAELDNAEELDAGDPVEFGQQLTEIRRNFPQINILGGCCGTDMRHMQSIADNL